MEVSDDGGVHVDVSATADHRNYTEYDVGNFGGERSQGGNRGEAARLLDAVSGPTSDSPVSEQ